MSVRNRKYLCLIIDRHTKRQLAEYNIEVSSYGEGSWEDESVARLTALRKFEDELKFKPRLRAETEGIDWCVDCCEV